MISTLFHTLRARQLNQFGFDRGKILAHVVRRLARSGAPAVRSRLWTDAIYGWGNEEWSADEPYLAEVVRAAQGSKRPILECGSGLTTLLMGIVAARNGIALHALEHNPAWQSRVSQAVSAFGATTTTVHSAPLREYGDFDWYDPPLESMPDDFGLVVCDGPPQTTRGGRGGMLPTMRDRLAPKCIILLDDANRPAEWELVQRWAREVGHAPEINSSHRGFARVAL